MTSTPAAEAIAAFRRVADEVARRDWRGAAELCDPVSLRVFHRQMITGYSAPSYQPTIDDLRRRQPDMPREVAEYEVRQYQRHQADRLEHLEDELAGVRSVEDLAALEPVEAFGRWLEAHDSTYQLQRFLRRHPEVTPGQVSLTALPPDRLTVLGAVVDEPFAYVVYRRGIASREPRDAARFDDFFKPFSEEERAWLRETGSALVTLATLRRQPDGSWRLPADSSFLQGMVSFDHVQATEDCP